MTTFRIISNYDKGDFGFAGMHVFSSSMNLLYSEKERESILKLIQDYVKNDSRDYIITLEDENGQKFHAMDETSLTDLEELRDSGESEVEVQARNYFDIKLDGEHLV